MIVCSLVYAVYVFVGCLPRVDREYITHSTHVEPRQTDPISKRHTHTKARFFVVAMSNQYIIYREYGPHGGIYAEIIKPECTKYVLANTGACTHAK